MTLAPAELLRRGGRRSGRSRSGKDANVVVWDGDPFEFATRAEHVFVRGREARTPSRQDLLTDKYLPRTP